MPQSSFDKLKSLLNSSTNEPIKTQNLTENSPNFDEIESFLSKDNKMLAELNKQLKVIDFSQVLFSVDSLFSKDLIIAMVRKSLSENKVPVIVLFSTNYKSIIEKMAMAKIDIRKVFIIDTVSKGISKTVESKNVIFVDSLRNLTQLQIKVVNLIEENKDLCFIVDSICVLDLYHKEDVILKFVYSLTKLFHRKKVSALYLVSKKQMAPKLIQFFDDFVEIKGLN